MNPKLRTLTIGNTTYVLVDAEAQEKIGDLAQLQTADKETLVGAINEALLNGGSVDSVNGQTGVVVLTASDVGAATAAGLSQEVSDRTAADAQMQTQINALGNGAPIPVETIAEMTDPTKAYLYTGSETGESTGYWYTYNTTLQRFVPRGEYGAGVTIDATLTVAGAAADAKATGDEFANVNGRLQQDEAAIGNLSNLQTEDKTNLVAAINEAARSGTVKSVSVNSGTHVMPDANGNVNIHVDPASPEVVEGAVEDWLDNHPEATTTVDFAVVSKVFATVAAMTADVTLSAGDNVSTRGYYAEDDGGDANYIISASSAGVFYVTLNNGLYANLISEKGTLKAESIGIRAYASATNTPDTNIMTENVTRFNRAIYNGVYLVFGTGYYYFNAPVQLARKSTYTILGTSRESTHMIFPSSDGFYFCDPIYYNYYVIRGMHIKAYGHTIRCAEHCMTVLDSRFEWLNLESETGDCFHAPSYNVAKYTSGDRTIYDTCVQNCIFDFVNATAPLGAAYCNIMGMYTYYTHGNIITSKYGFRNCDGVIEEMNTLGTSVEHFIYYDKTNSHSLKWIFINVNAEALKKSFIYTEPPVARQPGEDANKPENVNDMTLSITAIRSGYGLASGISNHNIYPITVHAFASIYLLNAPKVILSPHYPTRYDTTAVKAPINCLRGNDIATYCGGPTITTILNDSGSPRTIYGTDISRSQMLSQNPIVGYTGYRSNLYASFVSYEHMYAPKIFGGKADQIWEVRTSNYDSESVNLNPSANYHFCDVFSIINDGDADRTFKYIGDSYPSGYPGRIITVWNSKSSAHNVILQNQTPSTVLNYGLHSSCDAPISIAPGECVHLILSYDTRTGGTKYLTWRPIATDASGGGSVVVPTKVSDLVNDAGYLNETAADEIYARQDAINEWHEVALTEEDWNAENGMFVVDVGSGKEVKEVVISGQIVNDGTQEDTMTIYFGIGNSKTVSRIYAAPAETSALATTVRRIGFTARIGVDAFTGPVSESATQAIKTACPMAFRYGTSTNTTHAINSDLQMTEGGVQRATNMYWSGNNPRYIKIQSANFIPEWACISVKYLLK